MPAKTVSQGSAAPAITAAPAAKAIAAVSLRRPGSARIISTGSYLKNRSERWVDPAPFRPGPPRRHSAGSAWTLRAHPGAEHLEEQEGVGRDVGRAVAGRLAGLHGGFALRRDDLV